MPLPGWKFAGYRRGNCDRSVEGSIIEAVDKKHLGHGFRSAARSDRRVSALGNLFSIDSDLYPGRITGILNSSSLDIVFHHYANVGDGFDCRKCTSKQYTYAISRKSVDPDLFQTRAKMFARPHDYSSFCRKGDIIRSIDRIEVGEEERLILAGRKGIGSIALPSISTGACGCPVAPASEVAPGASRDCLASENNSLKEVRTILFSREDMAIYERTAEIVPAENSP